VGDCKDLKELATLAVDLDIEEQISCEGQLGEGDDENDDNNLNGWSDVCDELSDEERRALDESLQPVRLVLAKASYQITQSTESVKSTYQFLSQLCKTAFAIKNSSTFILP
jgi:hypothetical protein